MKEAGLAVTCVTPDIWAQGKWGMGSFASNDQPSTAAIASEEVMMWAKH